MALDRLTKIDGGGISTTSDYRVGVITATKFAGPLDGTAGNFSGVITATNGIFSGNISAVDGTFSGNVSIAGTLTYEDVTNIDSVGIITGKGADINGDLDVDGHTNLDNVSVAGVTTFSDNIHVQSSDDTLALFESTDALAQIQFKDNSSNANLPTIGIQGNSFYFNNMGSTSLRIAPGKVGVNEANPECDFHVNQNNAHTSTYYLDSDAGVLVENINGGANKKSVLKLIGNSALVYGFNGSGTLTFAQRQKETANFDTNGNFSLNYDLDVDGHTNLDNVSVAGITTHNEDVRFITANGGNILIDKSDNSIRLGQSVGLFYGTNKMWMQHNGSVGYLHNVTGSLYIRNEDSSGDIYIQGKSGEHSIICNYDGAVELYHDNIKRLETSSVGVSIPQDLDVDGHTNLDNVSVAGVSTFSGVLDATNTPASIRVAQDIQHKGDADTKLNFHEADKFRIELGGVTQAFSGRKSTSGISHAKWGINVGTPQAALHIDEAYNHQGVLRVTNGNQNANYYHQLEMSGTQNIFTLWRHFDGSSFNNTHAHGSTGHLWYIGGTERVRIDSNGRFLIGNTQDSSPYSWNLGLQVSGTSTNAGLSIRRDQSGSGGALLMFTKTGGALNGNTIVQDGDQIGGIYFNAADGTDVNNVVAQISATVDGTPGSNDTPGRLTFSTTADGANSPTERLRITSAGQVKVNASSESLGGKVLIKNNVNYNTTDFDDDPTLYLLNGDQTTGVSEAAIVLAGRNTAGSTYRAAISGNGSTGLKFYTTSNTESDDTPAMIINGSGKLGIGIENPDQKLHVYEQSGSGQAYIHVQNNRARNAAIKFTTTQGSWLVGQGIGVDSDRFSIYDTSERFVISNVGNCGVGQVAPAARLEVRDNQSNNYGTTIRLSQGYNSVFSEISTNFGGSMTLNAGEGGGSPIMHFQVNDDEKMRLDNSGNLTIGTSSWAYPKRLNVQGSSGHILSLYNGDTGTYAANTLSGIEFKLRTGNTGNQIASCEIRAFKENGTNGNSDRALSFYTGVNGGSPNERLRITSRGDVCVDNMAYNTYDTAGTNINTMVDNNEKRSGVYWINYGGEIFRAYIKANWCEDRNWILAAKFFDMQDMPSGSSLWTNDTWVNESDFNLYGGIFSKYPAWRYFPFDRLAMQMGNRIPPIMRFSSNQTLYGAFSGGRASNGGGVTASSTYPAMSGTSVTYHSMSNFMGPDFYDVGGSEDRMQSYGLNKWANNSTQATAAQNRGSENVHSGSRQDGGSLQYASLKGWGLTIEDSHPTINGIDSIAVAGAWIGCPLDEGNSRPGDDSSNPGADSGFGFGFCTGNPGRTGTAGYAEWGRGTECVNTLPAYIWLSAD